MPGRLSLARVRFGPSKEWFEADRAAVSFCSPGLPVPKVLEVGDAFDGAYAVSVRHYGTNLEDVRPDQSEVAGPMLADDVDEFSFIWPDTDEWENRWCRR